MALKIHGTDNIQAGTVQTQILASGVGGGPKITNIAVTDSSYTNLDDTAVGLSGGYIKITGTGFVTGCQVIVGTLVATSVTFISSTEVRAQIPAQSAGSYTLYLTNSDGGVAIRVNAVNYSSTPSWTTTSPLSGAVKNTSISLQLVATSNSAVTYALQAGSSLPSGLSLSSSGLITGTTPNVANETTYNFTVVATDSENQDTPQAFQITIIVGDPYYGLVTLHLPGTGTNLATNNTFLDGSTNNFTITRNGNTTQGTFSPFSQTGWGNYFDGTGDSLNTTSSSAFNFSTGSFTLECWFNKQGAGGFADAVGNVLIYTGSGSNNATWLGVTDSGTLIAKIGYSGSWATEISGGSVSNGVWNHVALVRNGTAVNLYLNGTSIASASNSTDLSTFGTNSSIAVNYTSTRTFNGYISNARIVNSVAVYTGNFTPPTSPLAATQSAGTNISAITGTQTSLLTCQSNRFIDNSTNNFTITRNGDTRVVAFSPFNPTASWSAATYGGSGYFDGSGDGLTYTTPSTVVREWWVNDFTVEAWVYPTSLTGWSYVSTPITLPTLIGNASTSANVNYWSFGPINTGAVSLVYWNGGSVVVSSTETVKINQWNHIAFTKTSSGVSIFVNGIGTTATAVSGTPQSQNSVPLSIGLINATSINGYASNVRIVNGTAVYSGTTYTVPTAPLTAITNTQLLLNFTNAGIYDATSKNVLETVGDAKISTAQSKWAGSSMAFDGTGDYLAIPANPLFNQNYATTSKFTIEFWFYQQALAGAGTAATVISTYGGGGGADGWRIETSANAPANSIRWVSNGSDTACSATIELNTWIHFAFTYNGTTIKVFKNGVLGNTATTSWTNNTGRMFIGTANAGLAFPITGYLSDLRITNAERYTANFTAPTSAFPTL